MFFDLDVGLAIATGVAALYAVSHAIFFDFDFGLGVAFAAGPPQFVADLLLCE